MVRIFRDCPKPVIAAIEGGAAGAGVSLALACDLVVAAEDAYFSVAYVKIGLTPDGGATSFLSGAMPRQLVNELCLTGDRIGVDRLHHFGLVNRLVAPGAALDVALDIAQRISSGPSRSMARIKELGYLGQSASLEDQLEHEAVRMSDSLGDAEAAEGTRAFLEKRPADFASLRKSHSQRH
jgi:enoyl-CoA hydratase/carnithine racemase